MLSLLLAGMDSGYCCGWCSNLVCVGGTLAAQRAHAASSKGSSVTVETVIRERESIIHGKGRLMYRRD